MNEGEQIWVVDRLERRTAVVVRDGSGETEDVPWAWLPAGLAEGTVLRVPLAADGSPDWSSASSDEELRKRRISEAREALEQLRKRDPGGDISL